MGEANLLLSPFDLPKWEFHSDFPPDECRKRLRRAIGERWQLFGSRSVIGSVATGRVWLRRRHFWLRCRLAPSLSIQIEPATSGTSLRCAVGIDRVLLAVQTLWVGLAALSCLAFTLGISAGTIQLTSNISLDAFFVPFGILVLSVVSLICDLWLARRDVDFLRRLLSDLTNAHLAGGS